MDLTLIINPGSSSKKYAVYVEDRCLITARFERVTDGFARCIQINNEQQSCLDSTETEYTNALTSFIALTKEAGILNKRAILSKIGIRVVAPGNKFAQHLRIDTAYQEELAATVAVAPLHIPAVLEEIKAAEALALDIPIFAISDSAFHQSIPSYRRQYSLPEARSHNIEKFGYHGLSVSSVVAAAPRLLDGLPRKMIVAHIGSGISITALHEGKSVYTSMGYTPASGVLMSSRAGDIDPGALITLLSINDLGGPLAHEYIQTQGGLKGLTGESDLRTVMQREAQDEPSANDALLLFFESIQRGIAEAVVPLGGIDALVFTGTAAERNSDVRRRIVAGLAHLDLVINDALNQSSVKKPQIISPFNHRPRIAIIPTNEMGEMARICQTL